MQDFYLEICQLEHLPKNWLVDSSDWVHVFAKAVSPEISRSFKKMVMETVVRQDYKVHDGPAKTFARTLAKCREYYSTLRKDHPARFKNFVNKFEGTFGRKPGKVQDYVWNVVNFARCSINVPDAKDVLNVKRMVEKDRKFTIVSVKNGYSKRFYVTSSGYRDLKLLVKVEFDNLELRGIPNVESKTILVCELQILCEKWLDNKKITSLSYKILRAETLNSMFEDFAKYRTREYFQDLLAYFSATETIKNGWRNLAKVADFQQYDPNELLCFSSIGGWSREGVSYLLENKKANIETRYEDYNAYGNTPLILAAKHGRHKIVQHLLSYGCDINAATTD